MIEYVYYASTGTLSIYFVPIDTCKITHSEDITTGILIDYLETKIVSIDVFNAQYEEVDWNYDETHDALTITLYRDVDVTKVNKTLHDNIWVCDGVIVITNVSQTCS